MVFAMASLTHGLGMVGVDCGGETKSWDGGTGRSGVIDPMNGGISRGLAPLRGQSVAFPPRIFFEGSASGSDARSGEVCILGRTEAAFLMAGEMRGSRPHLFFA
jgi:hypothetical protein